jgi:hypothetical protein
MRTARFFKDFEITDGYLILKSFQRTRIESSLILERTRTSNSLKIQRAAQHWFILHTRSTLPNTHHVIWVPVHVLFALLPMDLAQGGLAYWVP